MTVTIISNSVYPSHFFQKLSCGLWWWHCDNDGDSDDDVV